MSEPAKVTRRGALRVVSCASAVLCAHVMGCVPGIGGDGGISDETSRLFDVPEPGAAPLLDSEVRVAIVRVEDRVYAHSTLCTHEQCVIGFNDNDGGFACPCHGARYAADGTRLAAPAPRALDRHPLSLTGEGRLEVDLTVQLREGEAGYDDAFVTAPA